MTLVAKKYLEDQVRVVYNRHGNRMATRTAAVSNFDRGFTEGKKRSSGLCDIPALCHNMVFRELNYQRIPHNIIQVNYIDDIQFILESSKEQAPLMS